MKKRPLGISGEHRRHATAAAAAVEEEEMADLVHVTDT